MTSRRWAAPPTRSSLLRTGSDMTRIIVLDGDGGRETGTAGNRILTVLHERLE